MKPLLKDMNVFAKRVFVSGQFLLLALVVFSALLYFGAGSYFDYHFAKEWSGILLNSARPVSVGVSAATLLLEYRLRQ